MKHSRDILKSSKGTRTSGKSTITLWLHNKLYLILHFLNKIFFVFVFLFSNLSRFGFVLKNVFPLFVQFQPGTNHLAGVNSHMGSCAVRFLTWRPFDRDNSFLSVHLHHSVDLLTFVVSPNHLDLVVLAIGTKHSLYFRRSSLESQADVIFLRMCKESLQWWLRFLLQS